MYWMKASELQQRYAVGERDFFGIHLSDAKLSQIQLSFSDLSEADLDGADLSGADLREVNMSSTNLSGANLSGADLRKANLSGANLRNANLAGANLGEANLDGANLITGNLSGANLSSAALRADFKDANLENANLTNANLSGACLYCTKLSGANLTDANLISACLYGADLSSTNLSGACLYCANLQDANLQDAYLSFLKYYDTGQANLYCANLGGANLSGAILRGVDLSGTRLSGANLANANLAGAYLEEAEICEATILSTRKISSSSDIDWTIPLRSQQADFISRVKSGYLLHNETEGQHSELTVISVERTNQLRDFCWEMAEKYKRNSPIRKVFIDNMKGKLGEEVVKARLAEFVTEVNYEKRIGGDGKVDFRLTSEPTVGIQVKARYGNIDSIQWWISLEEVEKNAALVCVLIQEDVHEAQAKYNLILAGFLPTNMIKLEHGKASVGINQLLYGGGLRSYLNSINCH